MSTKPSPIFSCVGCVEREPKVGSLAHWLSCPGYAALRADKDLSEEADLLAYYKEVIKSRAEEMTV